MNQARQFAKKEQSAPPTASNACFAVRLEKHGDHFVAEFETKSGGIEHEQGAVEGEHGLCLLVGDAQARQMGEMFHADNFDPQVAPAGGRKAIGLASAGDVVAVFFKALDPA